MTKPKAANATPKKTAPTATELPPQNAAPSTESPAAGNNGNGNGATNRPLPSPIRSGSNLPPRKSHHAKHPTAPGQPTPRPLLQAPPEPPTAAKALTFTDGIMAFLNRRIL